MQQGLCLPAQLDEVSSAVVVCFLLSCWQLKAAVIRSRAAGVESCGFYNVGYGKEQLVYLT